MLIESIQVYLDVRLSLLKGKGKQMKVYRGRIYLGDQFLTETFYTESEDDQAWWERAKNDIRNHSNQHMRLEIAVFEQVGDVEVIVPDSPAGDYYIDPDRTA